MEREERRGGRGGRIERETERERRTRAYARENMSEPREHVGVRGVVSVMRTKLLFRNSVTH